MAKSYSPSEIAYVLGLARRTVNAKLDARAIMGFKIPSTGVTAWTWRVPHGALLAFLQRNPEYGFALNRIQGCEPSREDRAENGKVRTQKEPLIPPGALGWRGHPNQTRRGGFKPGPKLADGRQPSLTREDIAAREDADRPGPADSPTEP
jgi:hypothetical protein